MAAIDKLYVKEYYDLYILRLWALIYYPKLLFYFYDSALMATNIKGKTPIMNTPFKVDKKLKWICPVGCVREYLVNQCGVKEHWYYKLFWRGKKYFYGY